MALRSNSKAPPTSPIIKPSRQKSHPSDVSIAHQRGGKGGANHALEMGYYLQPLPGNLVPTSRPEKTE